MTLAREHVTGLLLAGGLGRRMGGVDKGLVAFNGRPLAAWALERLQPQVADVIINANRGLVEWQALGPRVVADRIVGFAGPLAGLHAGLSICATPYLVSVPCDSPYLAPDLVARLGAGLLAAQADLAVARTAQGLQPVFVLARRSVLPSLQAYLESGQRKAEAWLAANYAVAVDFADELAFANLNTLEELNGAASPVPSFSGSA